MKKRIMIVGPENSVNNQLVNLFEPTQIRQNIGSIIYYEETIQIPSSYMRSPSMTKHLIATQQKASCILMLLSTKCENKSRIYPPNIAKVFRVPRIGVLIIDKKTYNQNLNNLTKCKEELVSAGVDEIYELDIRDKENGKDFLKKIELVKKK